MARKDGYWSGYHDYRYGSAKKPTLKRVLTGEKKEHVVSKVMDLMRDWRFSRFENEGPVRHGLRSSLCLEGFGWKIADHEADLVVSETLRLIGAERPDWDEGQRQYVIAQECCQWCAAEIPEEDRTGLRQARFCSSVCARSALEHRDWETRWKESSVGRSAFEIIRRDRNPMLACEYCGARYRPFNSGTKDQRFCSQDCVRLALRSVPERQCPTCDVTFRPKMNRQHYCSIECVSARTYDPIPCAMCNDEFVPKHKVSRYCSSACLQRHRKIRIAATHGKRHNVIGTLFDGTCRHCHQAYIARSPKAKYCGTRCRDAAHTVRKRQGNVIYLTAEIFDGWFKRAA